MIRRLALALVVLLGVGGGALTVAALQGTPGANAPPPADATGAPGAAPTSAGLSPTTAGLSPTTAGLSPTTVPGSPPASTVPAAPGVVLAWSSGGLPAGVAEALRAAGLTGPLTVVAGATVELQSSADADGHVVDAPGHGRVIPLDAMAFDPATFVDFVPTSLRPVFAKLGADQAILGLTSARLRRLSSGGSITLSSGATFSVAAIVPDTVVGGAELAVSAPGAEEAGIGTDRYLLAADPRDLSTVEATIRSVMPAGLPTRVRGPGETPFLRAGDAVLPQALIKAQFGEFAYRPSTGGSDEFEQDPAWQTDNIVRTQVPILGTVQCHRGLVAALAGAMGELEQEGLASLVDPAGYQGCWNPRFTRSGNGVSRHAWGAAVDINVGTNPTNVGSAQDPRLVAVMEQWGFTWGGDWLVPDPSHFEYVR